MTKEEIISAAEKEIPESKIMGFGSWANEMAESFTKANRTSFIRGVEWLLNEQTMRDFLRHLVDITWSHVNEDTSVPATSVADMLIEKTMSSSPKYPKTLPTKHSPATEEIILAKIYEHLDSIFYEGGFPSDWQKSLANHLSSSLIDVNQWHQPTENIDMTKRVIVRFRDKNVDGWKYNIYRDSNIFNFFKNSGWKFIEWMYIPE